MKPFEYRASTSIDEAIALLAARGEQARPLAGGTDLLGQLRRGRFDLDLIVDVKKIPELNQISFDLTEGLVVGAAVTCARLYESPDVQEKYPALVDAVSMIGDIGIQGRATLGGNLCNAAPSGDGISAMIALNATCTIAGPQGDRAVPVEAFCTGPGQTVLENGEILVSIHFPAPKPNSGARYLRFTPRREMDIAVVGAAAWVELSHDQVEIKDTRIALATAAPTPLLAKAASLSLVGKPPSEDAFTEAAKLAQEAAKPRTSARGTIAQRRHLIGVLVKRALRDATHRATGTLARPLGEGEKIDD